MTSKPLPKKGTSTVFETGYEPIVISMSEYGGRVRLDLRHYYHLKDDMGRPGEEIAPTKKGVQVSWADDVADRFIGAVLGQRIKMLVWEFNPEFRKDPDLWDAFLEYCDDAENEEGYGYWYRMTSEDDVLKDFLLAIEATCEDNERSARLTEKYHISSVRAETTVTNVSFNVSWNGELA